MIQLKKLVLLPKYTFQFLNAFILSCQYQVMFSVWHSSQIGDAIIAPNAIKMVDEPTFRKHSVIGLFPYINMLKDKPFHRATLIGSWMVWFIDHPIPVVLPSISLCSIFANFPKIFPGTTWTTMSASKCVHAMVLSNWLPAIKALLYFLCKPLTYQASDDTRRIFELTDSALSFISFVKYSFRSHINIMAQSLLRCQVI